MKRIANKAIRDEKGQALLIVVILMLVGGLIIAPLLGFMSTGLIAGQVFEEKMEGLYAADAGMENACWKLLNGEWDINPTSTLTVNGMEVTVIELAVSADGTLYTLQSTAELAGETKAEIVAQVLVTVGSVAEGGEGGELDQNPDMKALSVIDEHTIIFATQQSNAEFWGREEENLGRGTGTAFEREDLALLNIATGTGALYLDGDVLGLLGSPKYEFYSVHYYQDSGNDYLLMSIKTGADVGPFPFTSFHIIRLQVDVSDDPVHPSIQSATVDPDPSHTIPGANIAALSRRDDGTILFSFSNPSVTLGSDTFERGQVIEYDPVAVTYTSLVNVNDILGVIPGNPSNLEIDCLAILEESDQRLLLSFTVDPVEGTDGVQIKSQDIAIWDPTDDSIILHISMCIDTYAPGSERTVSIISWEIS